MAEERSWYALSPCACVRRVSITCGAAVRIACVPSVTFENSSSFSFVWPDSTPYITVYNCLNFFFAAGMFTAILMHSETSVQQWFQSCCLTSSEYYIPQCTPSILLMRYISCSLCEGEAMIKEIGHRKMCITLRCICYLISWCFNCLILCTKINDAKHCLNAYHYL